MKIMSIDAIYKSSVYRLNNTWGLLLEYSINDTNKRYPLKHSEKVKKALHQIKHPYNLRPIEENVSIKMPPNLAFAKIFAKTCTIFCLKSFFFVRLLSLLRIPFFNTTQEATDFYRKLLRGKQQELCLSRTLFAAITSKTFKNKGVIFIGVFLPSRNMHAWIIEDGIQPDPYDTIWINYQPVAVLY